MRLIAVVLLLLVSSCATNYLRITEYEGAALPIPGVNAAGGGCMISTEGVPPPGNLTFKGEKCTYTSAPVAE